MNLQRRDRKDSKASFRKQTKIILKLLTYILRQWVYFMHLIFFSFLFFSSMGKYFESKTEIRRLKNKAFITICHLRYLEDTLLETKYTYIYNCYEKCMERQGRGPLGGQKLCHMCSIQPR